MKIEGKRIKDNIIYRKVYGIWKNMMNRCYNKEDANYKLYGGRGVVVCDRWKTFNNFVEDMDKIEGFSLEKLIEGKIALDKDKIDINNKIYCIKKCTFISKSENNKFKPNQQKQVIGVDPNGNEYVFLNQSEFAREHSLRQSSIGDCLSGKCKTHKKWKFYYKYQ